MANALVGWKEELDKQVEEEMMHSQWLRVEMEKPKAERRAGQTPREMMGAAAAAAE